MVLPKIHAHIAVADCTLLSLPVLAVNSFWCSVAWMQYNSAIDVDFLVNYTQLDADRLCCGYSPL